MAARKRHTDTVESVETLRDFFTYYLYRPTIDRDRYEIIPRGRHRARCVSRPMSCSRDATPGRGGGRGVAYACACRRRVSATCYVFPRGPPGCDIWTMVLRTDSAPRRRAERSAWPAIAGYARYCDFKCDLKKLPIANAIFVFPIPFLIFNDFRDLGPSPIGR